MTRDRGIRSLLPPVVDQEEEQLKAQAKAAVMQRLNVPDTPTPLPAAVDRIDALNNINTNVTFKPEFYKTPVTKKETEEKEFKKMMEKEYGHKTLEKDVRSKIYKNKKAGKAKYEGFATHDIIIAETMKDRASKQLKTQSAKTDNLMKQVYNYSPNKTAPFYLQDPVNNTIENVNAAPVKQKIKKILPIEVDPSHPDGFYFKDDKDVYDVYKDNPVRYIEEISRKYEGTPINSAVKEYDHLNKDTYPSNQQAALASYGKAYDRLTPMQKKQVENGKKKLFQNILPLKK